MLRRLAVVLVMGLLTGCDPLIGMAVASPAIAVLGSTPQTKKLPADHALSAVTGRDCSAVNYEKTGQYCPPYPQDIDRSNLSCIKTLGAVECYRRPNRYANGERTLASPPPPLRQE